MKYSEKRIASIYGNFVPSLALIYTLRLQKRGFLYKTAFLPGLKFSNLRTDVSLPQEKSGSPAIIVFGSPECWDSL